MVSKFHQSRETSDREMEILRMNIKSLNIFNC